MKTQTSIITLSAALAISLLAGCGKPTDSNPSPNQGEAAPATGTDAAKIIEGAKPAVEAAAKEVKETATAAVADATAKANGMIDQAKTLIGETKYSDALNVVQQLSSMKLTPEQEKLVAGLKDQIQKAMAAKATQDGTSAVGNLLKK